MSSRLTVLHVVPEMPDGTLPPFVQAQVDSLPGTAIDSALVPLRGSDVAKNPRAILREVRRIRETVKRVDPDIVHAHWGSFLSVAAAIGAGQRAFVVTYRGSDLNPVDGESPVGRRLRHTLSRLAAIRADAVVTVSQELADRLWGVRSLRVVPDGVDLRIFSPVDRDLARATLGWPNSETVLFLYEGGRPDAKGRPLAEAALRELVNCGVSCRLEVLDGGLTRADVALRINASDCVLMLSTHEGSPNIVREAIACGVPVVGVDVGDVRLWIERRPGSHLVPRDARKVAAAVRDVLTTPSRSYSSFAPDDISEVAARDALLRVYNEAVDRRGRSRPYSVETGSVLGDLHREPDRMS